MITYIRKPSNQVLEYDLKPECLVILAEEEMVFIDLGFIICLCSISSSTLIITLQYCPVSASKGWPVFQPPYLHSIHASAITCLSEVCSLHPEVLARLETHSPGPPSGAYVLPSQVHSLPFSLQLTFPQRPWPVDGGEANPPAAVPPSLILTGSTFL